MYPFRQLTVIIHVLQNYTLYVLKLVFDYG